MCCVVFLTLYISAGIVGFGRAISSIFGLGYHTSIVIGTFLVASYTLVGGFLAVAWNDFK